MHGFIGKGTDKVFLRYALISPPAGKEGGVIENKKKVYVETSVISNLTARPSHNPIDVAAQIATAQWWCDAPSRFELFVSSLVLEEVSRGDAVAAAKRIDVVQELQSLNIDERCTVLAEKLLEATAVPCTSLDDATHIATAAINGMDYLVTWNCSHIANAQTRPLIRKVLAEAGNFEMEICTPLEMMGGNNGN